MNVGAWWISCYASVSNLKDLRSFAWAPIIHWMMVGISKMAMNAKCRGKNNSWLCKGVHNLVELMVLQNHEG